MTNSDVDVGLIILTLIAWLDNQCLASMTSECLTPTMDITILLAPCLGAGWDYLMANAWHKQ